MACKVTPAFYAVLVLGVMAFGLHMIGFTTTGWVIMSRKFTVEEIKLTTSLVIEQAIRMSDIDLDRQKIDDGGMVPDENGMPQPPRDRPHDGPPHDGPRDGHPPHPPMDEERRDPPQERRRRQDKPHHHIEVIEETTRVQEWIKESVVEIEHVYLKIKYGLWKSKLCMSAKLESLEAEDETEMTEQDRDSSSSSSSEDGHKRRHRCHCRHISTQCALAMSTMFMDMTDVVAIEEAQHKPWYNFNTKYFFGNTCLTETRVETSVGLAMLVLAIIAGIMAFRKQDSCRCWLWTTLVCLMVAFVMISIPVHRVLRYNYHSVKDNLSGSNVHMPYALFTSLLSAVLTFILAIVVAVAICRRSRNRKWHRFDNEAEDVTSEKKGMPPSLVFIPEPLTAGEKKAIEAGEQGMF